MATFNFKSRRALLSYIFGILLIAIALALFSFGGIYFAAEYAQVLHYRNSTCTVASIAPVHSDCSRNREDSKCSMKQWQVTHNYGEQTSTALIVGPDVYYKLHSTHPCWYDTRKPSSAQWSEPSIRVAAILLACGCLATVLSIVSFILCRYYTMKKRREFAQNRAFIVQKSAEFRS